MYKNVLDNISKEEYRTQTVEVPARQKTQMHKMNYAILLVKGRLMSTFITHGGRKQK